jgi:hypothetical protein
MLMVRQIPLYTGPSLYSLRINYGQLLKQCPGKDVNVSGDRPSRGESDPGGTSLD